MAAPARGPTATFSGDQKILLMLLFSMTVLNYLDRHSLSVVAPVIRRELGLTQVQYAHAVNAFLIAYGLMYSGSGIVLDRIGYRTGLAFFAAFWSVACALHAAITGFWSLIAYRLLLGLAEPGGLTGAVKTVSKRFSAAQRGLATGIFIAGTGVGSLIAPPLIVFLSVRYSWRLAFLFAGAVGLFWLPLWLAATKPDGTARADGADSAGGSRRLAPLLADSRVRAYLLAVSWRMGFITTSCSGCRNIW